MKIGEPYERYLMKIYNLKIRDKYEGCSIKTNTGATTPLLYKNL